MLKEQKRGQRTLTGVSKGLGVRRGGQRDIGGQIMWGSDPERTSNLILSKIENLGRFVHIQSDLSLKI